MRLPAMVTPSIHPLDSVKTQFYVPPNAKIIHVRSASRLGYSDLGVNRKRIEAIRGRLVQAGA